MQEQLIRDMHYPKHWRQKNNKTLPAFKALMIYRKKDINNYKTLGAVIEIYLRKSGVEGECG